MPVTSRRRDGVRPDLEAIFRGNYPRVVAVAARVLGSRDQAEDVAQEVFLSFGRSTVPAGEAGGWLSVAAAHTALNLLRSGRRRAAREETAATADPRSSPTSPTIVVTLEERSRVRAALGPTAPQAGRRPGPTAQRPQLRRGRRGPRPVPRQRRHHRATRRVRPSQGVEPSCVIRLRACCAGWSTSRPAWPTPTARTSPAAPRACAAWTPPATDAQLVGSALAAPTTATSTSTGPGPGCPATTAARGPARTPARCRRAPAGRLGGLVRRPDAAVAGLGVVLAGAGVAAANDWLPIFRTEEVAPGRGDHRRPGPAARPQRLRRPRGHPGADDAATVPDAAAPRRTGLAVPEVSELPEG